MKHFAASFLLLVASLSATSAFAQESDAPQAQDLTARFAPAPLPEPTAPEAAPTVAAPALVDLTGYVLDEQKRPLRGATVLLKGTTNAASTDANGHYVLQVPAGINILRYDYMGREGQELSASNFLPVTVMLAPASGKGRATKRP
ncbi:carboxypeptidase-like regulatory domain-containing protein [Hymenobacter yonginensis]|uniref:Carboxypeptidase-like regulatory domain-containing protein n=1 Tax=Hymenobacter yonginensis TaxID=748197 RepID=A0ABY7PQE5_9BACT|nr:carboxypeptidase-like regulatory domain-containing protein [Hymenobacter yonginensis]WBO84315.1 carboxypeptidase-like regulatory domain-containing protein [Hymenobacter yonginensis]